MRREEEGEERGRGEKRRRMREKEQETCANLQICCPLMAADRWSDNPPSNTGAIMIWRNPILLLFHLDEIHVRLPCSGVENHHLSRKGLVSLFRAARQLRGTN